MGRKKKKRRGMRTDNPLVVHKKAGKNRILCRVVKKKTVTRPILATDDWSRVECQKCWRELEREKERVDIRIQQRENESIS